MTHRSKFHHVGIEEDRYNRFTALRPEVQGDCENLAVNPKWVVYPKSGHSVVVLDINKPTKVGSDYGQIQCHQGKVVDIKFCPFNFDVFATSSMDGTVSLWQIPNGGIEKGKTITADKALTSLSGHEKKLGQIDFHPTVGNVIASSSLDKTIRLWDYSKGEEKVCIETKNVPLTFDFDALGNKLAFTSRDKKLYMADIRAENKIVLEAQAYVQTKGFRVGYLRNDDLLFTTGFERGASRTVKLWDPRKFEKEVKAIELDNASSVLLIFVDQDLGLVYCVGKGEATIRYFDANKINAGKQEGMVPNLIQINKMHSVIAAKGAAMAHKLSLNTTNHEIGRIYKLTEDSIIPCPVVFPRKIKSFQKELFPETAGFEVPNTADDFFSGKELKEVSKISLKPGERPEGVGMEQKEVEVVKKEGKKIKKRENLDLIGRPELAKIVLGLQEKLAKHGEEMDVEYFYKI